MSNCWQERKPSLAVIMPAEYAEEEEKMVSK
jgi:hypothetical protein